MIQRFTHVVSEGTFLRTYGSSQILCSQIFCTSRMPHHNTPSQTLLFFCTCDQKKRFVSTIVPGDEQQLPLRQLSLPNMIRLSSVNISFTFSQVHESPVEIKEQYLPPLYHVSKSARFQRKSLRTGWGLSTQRMPSRPFSYFPHFEWRHEMKNKNELRNTTVRESTMWQALSSKGTLFSHRLLKRFIFRNKQEETNLVSHESFNQRQMTT